MMGVSGNGSGRSERPPFTPIQWQELEHQALVYKYMVSGVPVPPELVFSIRRSLDSSFAARLLPHQPFGWGCFQMGFGRKPDPEPGRCRRTDGKKWRCSREAYPDSKYCEKHMHRGRNRARKSLESPTALSFTNSSSNKSFPSPNLSSSSSSSVDGYSNSSSIITAAHQTSPRFSSNSSSSNNSNSSRGYLSYSLSYPYPSPSSSSSKPSDSGLSLQNSSSHLNVLASGACPQSDKDFRYLHGTLEGVGERTFFPEASRSFQESAYHQPLTAMSSPYHQREHCFVLGTDMFHKPPVAVTKASEQQEQDQEQEPKKPLHHFFGDDWLDLSSNPERYKP
ncbi:PREDICTED: growth-regulating factor 5 [Tarenaya hassleriana]|uniref:growth-regulating factor 5 n=1 Tax=Tarenaya hassleriana TaxID=28532 RepID=UPI00053C170E|nr:PREDICTED: growth-regulating factor 5 [Tarenaya hassleriana]